MAPTTADEPSLTAGSAAIAAAALALVPALAAAAGLSADRPADGPEPGTTAASDTLRSLPSATLEDLDGRSVDIRSVVEGPAVVNFWATWCGPCRREMPELARLHRELRDEGLQVVGIAVSSGSPEEIREFAERHGAEYLLLRASREWARRHFRLYGMPTTLIVDAEGRIRKRLVGPQTAEDLREDLEPLLPGGDADADAAAGRSPDPGPPGLDRRDRLRASRGRSPR